MRSAVLAVQFAEIIYVSKYKRVVREREREVLALYRIKVSCTVHAVLSLAPKWCATTAITGDCSR